MANIHRLSNYDNNNPTTQPFPGMRQGQRVPSNDSTGQGGQGGQGQQQQQQQVLFVGGGDDGGGNVSPYPPLNKVLAPDFGRYTFIFMITCLQIIFFICELIVGQAKYDGAFVTDNDMAGPSTDTFIAMGAKYLPDIQKGEIHRFVVPALLHAGILHIFTNLVSQTFIGYTCEKQWGWRLMAFFYFMCAFGATLLSCVASPCSVSVGASGALLGIIGAEMAWLVVNWNNRDLIVSPGQRMCNMVWWLFIIFIIGLSSPGIDNYAHLGGWLSGILLGFAICEYTEVAGCIEHSQKLWKYGSACLCLIYFLLTLIFSFTSVKC